MRVIFSFTDTDPEDITGLDYHGVTNRGSKSIVLINYNDGEQQLPDDSFPMDILITEVAENIFEIRTFIKRNYDKVQNRKCMNNKTLYISLLICSTQHTVPKKRTSYWCEYMKVPQMEQKHHVVMVNVIFMVFFVGKE